MVLTKGSHSNAMDAGNGSARPAPKEWCKGVVNQKGGDIYETLYFSYSSFVDGAK